jgi:hypothetical protein
MRKTKDARLGTSFAIANVENVPNWHSPQSTHVPIGDGCQVGAGTLVISDLPARSVAVGVPAKKTGSFVDVTERPSSEMSQMMDGITSFQLDVK